MEEEFNLFLSSAFNRASSTPIIGIIAEDLYKNILEQVELIMEIIREITLAFKIGFILGIITSVSIFLANELLLLVDFNRRIIGLRKGISDEE